MMPLFFFQDFVDSLNGRKSCTELCFDVKALAEIFVSDIHYSLGTFSKQALKSRGKPLEIKIVRRDVNSHLVYLQNDVVHR